MEFHTAMPEQTPPVMGASVVLIPLRDRTGVVIAHAMIDAEDAHLTDGKLWSISRNKAGHPYVRWRRQDNKHIKLHRLIMGLDFGDKMVVDHINGDQLDNRKANLRLLTRGQNIQNRHKSQGASKYRGVCWDKSRQKWKATVTLNYKAHQLGRFDTEEEAAAVALAFRREHMPFATN
jgi:hypothetical protein